MIRRLDMVEFKPEWKDPGDDDYWWLAMEDQIPGSDTIKVSAFAKDGSDKNLRFRAINTVGIEMLKCDADHYDDSQDGR